MKTVQPDRPISGALWMGLSGLCFIGVYVGVKYVGTRLPAAESAFLRYALGLVFLLPVVRSLWREGLPSQVIKLGIGRAVLHTFAVTLWFYAMARIPIAEVSSMGYLTPIFVTLGAVLIMGESLAFRRGLAIAIAIIGVLIILRPGFREVSMGHLAMLGATLCFGISYLMAKRLTDLASADMVIALLSIGVTIGLIPLTIPVWITPTSSEVGTLFTVAIFAVAGHYSMTFAFRSASLTVTQPVTFLQLIWAVAVGYLLFGENIDAFVVLGGAIIIGAVLYITLREAQLRKKTERTAL
ncbi:MAG: DMT family transporter [Planktomarina sp.]|jgi:drug/metabolite transporter (DMT)-like permease|nr:DMT family transporter [Planktomarina sp.]MDT2056881.1 DMT family transporter [Planktomarina sp.]MDT2071916.1 DMT family transporter [Planktomarina sp.]MDT2077101.1 DMT family transporter [Planktomarina sp.]HAJ85102.1 EamA family transporter [Paracoccaceae bacterium]|tara:strand:+ start:3644 stop:4534 length:891 start_codon:yes stop_codon:yes gene_type:complete